MSPIMQVYSSATPSGALPSGGREGSLQRSSRWGVRHPGALPRRLQKEPHKEPLQDGGSGGGQWSDRSVRRGVSVLTQWCADLCIVGSLPTRDGLLCAVCMLLCVVPSFAVLPGVLMCVSYMGELTV